MLYPDVAKSAPCWLSQFSISKLRQPTGQRLSNVRGKQKKSIGPILFLYYEESLVSSNLNSKQLRFHGAHPTYIVSTYFEKIEKDLLHGSNELEWLLWLLLLWWICKQIQNGTTSLHGTYQLLKYASMQYLEKLN